MSESLHQLKISVVLATHNRWELLSRCLMSLINQTFPKECYEIVVIDDHSRSGVARIIARHTAADLPRIRFYSSSKHGPAAARNRGILQSKGSIIAFTDDDCIPDSNWLETIHDFFEREPDVGGVGGLTYSITDQIGPFTHQVEDALPYSFPSCNVAFRQTVLQKTGGFDEDYLYPYNEDWDLSFAVQRIAPMVYEPSMRVCHPPRQESFKCKLQRVAYLSTEFRLFHKYPKEYRLSVHKHPWRVILYHQFLVQFCLQIRRHVKVLFSNPLLFLKFLILLFCQRCYLLLLIPKFIRENRFLTNQE